MSEAVNNIKSTLVVEEFKVEPVVEEDVAALPTMHRQQPMRPLTMIPSEEVKTEPIYVSDDSSDDQPELKQELPSPTRLLKFSCQICERVFHQVGDLVQHVRFCRGPNTIGEEDVKSEEEEESSDELANEEDLYEDVEFVESFDQDGGESTKSLSCRLCGNIYKNKDDLDEHYEDCVKHEGTPQFFCIICGNRFHEEATLQKHYDACKKDTEATPADEEEEEEDEESESVSIGSDKRYTCDKCGDIFKRNHMLQNHKKECGKQPKEDDDLNDVSNAEDEEAVEEIKDEWKCRVCGKAFRDKWNLRSHMPVHTNERRFPCSHCGNKFKYKSDMLKHYYKCKNIKEMPTFQCSKCNNKYHTKETLDRHFRNCNRSFVSKFTITDDGDSINSDPEDEDYFVVTEEGSRVVNHKCRICSKIIKYKKNVPQHMMLHGATRPFKCHICGNRYKRRDTCNSHVKTCATMKSLPKYKCRMCENKFQTEKLLNFHIRICGFKAVNAQDLTKKDRKRQLGTHKCLICHKVMHKGSLTKHMLIHSSYKPFACGKCGNTYRRKDALEYHENICHKVTTTPKFICKICGNKYHSEKALNTHVGYCNGATKAQSGAIEEEPELHNCPICPRRFRFKRNLMEHIPTHDSERPYKCNKCGNQYKRRDTHASHVKMCLRQKKEPQFPCDICGNRFYMEKVFKRHYNTCKQEAEDPTAATTDEAKERLHRCPICFKVIGCKNSVLLHLRTHSPDKPFKCDKCGNAYSGKENLVSHVRVCEEKQGTPKFFCEICGNRFYCSKTLSAHKGGCISTARKLNLKRPQREASVGPQLSTYECHVCHQKFNLKKEMEAHMYIHEDAMPYKCNKCGNQYRRRDYLITHRRTCLQMSSDPEYRCGFCSNRFYKEIFWKRHERQCKVNPEKPLMETYECHICNKVFRYKSDLQRHIETHNTTRSYVCKKCGNKYRTLKTLNFHEKVCEKHNGLPRFTCNICGNKFYDLRVLKGHKHKCKLEAGLFYEGLIKSEPQDDDTMDFTVKEDVEDATEEALEDDATMDDAVDDATINETFGETVQYTIEEVDEEPIHKCSVCPKEFKDETYLAKHMKFHESSETCTCEKCGNLYRKQDTLQRHQRVCKSMKNMPEYSCEMCCNKFYWKENLLKHTYKCSMEVLNDEGWFIPKVKTEGITEEELTCSICFIKTKYRSELKRHMLTHNNIKPYKCAKCGNMYKWKDVLRRHMKVCMKTVGKPKYACELCGNKFHKQHIYTRHLQICRKQASKKEDVMIPVKKEDSKEALHKCPSCSMVFKEKWIMKRHMRMHSPVKPYECTKCGNRYRRNDALVYHSQTCLENKTQPTHACEKCGNKYYSIIALNTHMNFCSSKGTPSGKSGNADPDKEQKGEGLLRCPICLKVQIYKSELERHMLTHSSVKSFKCVKCGNKYKRKNALLRHVRFCLEMEGQPMYVCESCGNKFHWEKALQKHIHKCRYDISVKDDPPVIAKDDKVEINQCSICFKKFKDKFILRRHLLVHSTVMPFQCTTCGNKFRRNDSLVHHQAICASMKTKPKYICTGCGNKYHSKIALNTHVTACKLNPFGKRRSPSYDSHDEKKMELHKCLDCPKEFIYRSVLERHMLTHTSAKSYECAKCGNKYKRKETLYHHVKNCVKVKGEPKYPCLICGNKFYLASVLKKHVHKCEIEAKFFGKLEANEGKVDIHKCPICSKVVKDKFILRRHMVIHSKLMPYKCNKCGNKYKSNDKLYEHQRKCSAIKVEPQYMCDGCGNKYHSNISLHTHMNFCRSSATSNTQKQLSASEEERESDAYKCAKCGNTYGQKESLHRHVEICSKMKHDPTFLCGSCGNKFYSEKECNAHSAICKFVNEMFSGSSNSSGDANVVNYECSICSKVIKYKRNVTEHMMSHTGPLLQCFKCGNSYQHERSLSDHKKICLAMKSEPKVACGTCGNKFYKVSSLRSHRATCRNDRGGIDHIIMNIVHPDGSSEDVYKCTVCEMEFKKPRYLRQHMSVHKVERPFVCTKCGNKYKRQSGLSHHMELCKRMTTEPKYVCENCGNKYHKPVTLEMHIGFCRYTSARNSQKPAGSMSASELEVSRLINLINVNVAAANGDSSVLGEAEVHKCAICFKIFKEKRYLKRHMVCHQEKRPTFKCEKCGNEYMRSDSYKVHVTYCHQISTDPQFLCGICGNKFYKEIHLKSHLMKCKAFMENIPENSESTESETESSAKGEGGEALFKCTKCGVGQKSKKLLEFHMKMCKMADKPKYACIICGRRFHMRLTLEKHKPLCQLQNHAYQSRVANQNTLKMVAPTESVIIEEEKPLHLVDIDYGNEGVSQASMHHSTVNEENQNSKLKDLSSVSGVSNSTAVTVKEEPMEYANEVFTITELPEEITSKEQQHIESIPQLVPISSESTIVVPRITSVTSLEQQQPIESIPQLTTISSGSTTVVPRTTSVTSLEQPPQYIINVSNENNSYKINIVPATSSTSSTVQQQSSSTAQQQPAPSAPIPSTSKEGSSSDEVFCIDDDDDPIVPGQVAQNEYRALNRPSTSKQGGNSNSHYDVIDVEDEIDRHRVFNALPTRESSIAPPKLIPYVQCSKCRKKYSNMPDLHEHQRICLTTQTIFQCPTCGKRYPTIILYRQHEKVCMKVYEKPVPLACRMPPGTSTAQIVEVPAMYKCHICVRDFREKSHLDQHIQMVHINVDRSYECSKCGNKYRWRNTLTSHEKVCHPAGGMPEFKCKTCNNRFYSIHNFRGHAEVCKRVNTMNEDGRRRLPRAKPDPEFFQCKLCFKVFRLRISYLNHMHMHNDERKAHKCQLCGKKFAQEKEYDEHYRMCKAKVPCGTCGTRFTFQLDLIEHMKTCGKPQRIPAIVDLTEKPGDGGGEAETEHYQIVEIMYMDKEKGDAADNYELVMKDTV